MARRGDGIYQRGKTWRLDFQHEKVGTNANLSVKQALFSLLSLTSLSILTMLKGGDVHWGRLRQY